MALFEREIKDGIQLGHHLDYCYECCKPGTLIKNELEYKEVFKLRLNGLEYCLCLDHFKQKLGDYLLIHKDVVNKESKNVIEIPYELVENETEKEVLDYIGKAIKSNGYKNK